MKRVTTLLVFLLALVPLGAWADDDGGRRLFNHETFDGNGVTCGSCHRSDANKLSGFKNPFSFGPTFAKALHDRDPDDALFNPLNSKDAVGADFSQLFTDGTVPIPIRIPPNVTALPFDPTAVVHSDSQGQFVFLPRKTPTILNIGLKSELMLDGREGRDFLRQAGDAVATHDGVSARQPTADERVAIQNFQLGRFSAEAMRDLFQSGARRTLPPGRNASEALGRSLLLDTSPAGKCGQCHGGANLDRTSPFNVVNSLLGIPPGGAFATNFSSNFDTVNPRFVFVWSLAADPLTGQASTRTLISEDPGAVLNPGPDGSANPCAADPSACVINPTGTASEFVIPSLWDVGDREAAGLVFMHNGRFHTLDEVMDALYVPFFAITADGLGQITGQDFSFLKITPAERDGVVGYMRNCLREDSPCE